MRAVGTHNANFDEAEKGDHKDDPGYQEPAADMIDPGTAQNKRRKCNEKKVDQVLETEMTVKSGVDRTIITGRCFTGRNRFVGIQKHHIGNFLTVEKTAF